jgi:hypothetical protein
LKKGKIEKVHTTPVDTAAVVSGKDWQQVEHLSSVLCTNHHLITFRFSYLDWYPSILGSQTTKAGTIEHPSGRKYTSQENCLRRLDFIYTYVHFTHLN